MSLAETQSSLVQVVDVQAERVFESQSFDLVVASTVFRSSWGALQATARLFDDLLGGG